MSRLLALLGLVLAGLALLAGLAALLAYGPEPTREGTLSVRGLTSEAELAWTADGRVTVAADDELALWTGLGYAHAADHGWAMGLWRQAALGSLSEWVGPEATGLDRHARRLGFRALGREAYARLGPADREAVEAYARGVQRAFADAAVSERDEYVRLGVEAAPWEPWHALAVERMVAWLGAAPLGSGPLGADSLAPEAAAPPSAARDSFAVADSLFRDALALDGLRHARAYTAPARGGAALVAHQPYGASALPLLVGARLRLAGASVLAGTVPGTLILASGAGDGAGDGAGARGPDGWAVFLSSDARVAADTAAAPPPVTSRLVARDGDETLIEILRDEGGLVLREPVQAPRDTLAVDASGAAVLAPPDVADAGLRVRWAGFRPVSDVGAWRALLGGGQPTFQLFRGDGLLARGGGPLALGAPPVVAADSGAFLAAGHESARFAILRLGALARQRPALPSRLLATDVGSPWAAGQIRPLLTGLGNRDSLGLDLQDAYAFLRGWDGLYTPDAVAPTVAEAWIEAHRRVFGRAPDPRQRRDSLLLRQTLRLGLATLRDSLGEASGGWAWERWGGRLRYPVLGGEGRYRPLASRMGGHPTAPVPGPSLVLGGPGGPAAFTLWAGADGAGTSRPAVGTGAPRDGRDPVLTRPWASPEAAGATLRLVPASP